MKNHKGFIPLIAVLVIIGVLAVGGTAYVVGKNAGTKDIANSSDNQQVTQSVTSTTSTGNQNSVSTTKWKTYTNTGCGYSFQYPDSWSQVGNESNAINLQGDIMSRMISFIDTASQGVENSDGRNNQIYAPKDYLHIECSTMGADNYNYTLSNYNDNKSPFSQSKKMITVGGQTAIIGEMKNTATISSGERAGHTIIPSHNIFVYFLHKDQIKAFQIEFKTPLNAGDTVEINQFEQLLKTFKFF